ncbi:hypothetical protein [Ruegeria lacuscaerulensis]|uniref:hypothetical protein n=1 Tax=Ruegeria lacuscaerulensis TaxID=55218 RepID=UPI00147E7B5A|nr:hypothetical protein [Ruegeria lacuscaerulensis]
MNRLSFVIAVATMLGSPVLADGIMGNLKKGAEKVGQTVGKGVDAVGDTVDSTTELLSNEATPEETRAKLDAMASQILNQLMVENPQAQALYDISAGYAVFDSRKITVFPVAAGYGRGVAVSKETGEHTYMNMGTGGVGAALGIGGFETKYVILFETQADLDKFIDQGYDATAEAEAMHGYEKEGDTLRFTDGRSFFVLSKKGWRVSAGASGTKYWKSPELN